jgi:hypothetical protein
MSGKQTFSPLKFGEKQRFYGHSRGHRKRPPVFGTPLALSSWREAGIPVPSPRESPVVPRTCVSERSSLMNISAPSSTVSVGATRWSLTRADVFLCAVPIALFLSIVSLV